MGMYSEVRPDPPDISVTQTEAFKTANFSLPLGPWYPGEYTGAQMQLDTATAQVQVRIRQNGNKAR